MHAILVLEPFGVSADITCLHVGKSDSGYIGAAFTAVLKQGVQGLEVRELRKDQPKDFPTLGDNKECLRSGSGE